MFIQKTAPYDMLGEHESFYFSWKKKAKWTFYLNCANQCSSELQLQAS
jgi:hypothetical protein